MIQIILIILGVVVVGLFVSRRSRDAVVGICESALESATEKSERKGRILALLGERSELSNTDIREALGISSRSVVRYMDELEREGKVEQVGKIGHTVTYRLK